MRSRSLLSIVAAMALAASGCCVSRTVSSTPMAGGNCHSQAGSCSCDNQADCGGRCSTGLQGRLAQNGLLSRMRTANECSSEACGCGDNACESRGLLRNGGPGLLGVGSCGSGGACAGQCGGQCEGAGRGLASRVSERSLSLPAIGGRGYAQDYQMVDGSDRAHGHFHDRGIAMAGGSDGGGLLGSRGGLLGQNGGGIGCGQFGCGQGGRLCLGCRLRNGLGMRGRGQGGHPYGGQIPHTDPNFYGEGMGGPQGAYAYPYYTIRGPRDFLTDKPASIGW